jgi:hypothetical protein
MAVKVLVNTVGQHIVAETKQVENKETKELVAYWLSDPRLAAYNRDESGNIAVGFAPYCVISDEREFSVRPESVVAILEPRADVVEKYNEVVANDSVTPVVEESEGMEADVPEGEGTGEAA